MIEFFKGAVRQVMQAEGNHCGELSHARYIHLFCAPRRKARSNEAKRASVRYLPIPVPSAVESWKLFND